MFKDILCVIPARGGSKTIHRKNMVKVSGVPLVGYSIRSALNAGITPHNVVVSSDDKEILDYASKAWHVSTRKRPDELSGDFSSTEDAMIDVIKSFNFDFKTMLLLQPTSPIRFRNRIADAITIYRSGDYDSLLSATKLYPFFWQEKEHCGQRKFYSSYHPRSRPMRQEILPEEYRYFENGNLYLTDIKVLLETHCRIGDKVCVYPITEVEALQIDNKFDLEVVERIISGNSDSWFFRESVEVSGAYMQSNC